MPIMDVFNQDAFSYVSLCAAVDLVGYTPGFLTARPGLVTPAPIRTQEVWIEQRSFMPKVIQTTPRGAPPVQVSGDRRNARSFNTTRIALSGRINASELLGIRDFASETTMKDLMGEVARRHFKMRNDEAVTKENMLLGAVQGGRARRRQFGDRELVHQLERRGARDHRLQQRLFRRIA